MKKEMTTTAYEYFCDECNESIKNKYNCTLCGKMICEKCTKDMFIVVPYRDPFELPPSFTYCMSCYDIGVKSGYVKEINEFESKIIKLNNEWMIDVLQQINLEDIVELKWLHDSGMAHYNNEWMRYEMIDFKLIEKEHDKYLTFKIKNGDSLEEKCILLVDIISFKLKSE